MRIANTVSDSIVDGPGLRFTVFTQGCPHRCPGCHNPGTHDPAGGREVSVAELAAELAAGLSGNPLTDGLTLSGGEPFCQAAECAALARIARYVLEEDARPTLIVGMPVGFVNVVESKALLARCAVPQIALEGRRGGSALAVATLHAVMESA